MSTNAPQFLMNSPPGTAIWEWIDLISSTLIPVELDSTNLLSNHVPIFMANITLWDHSFLKEAVAPISVRAGAYNKRNQGVVLVYLLWGFSQSPPYIYECWINHYSAFHPSPLETLSRRSQLHFAFFDGSEVASRIYTIPNSLNWEPLLRLVKSTPPWSDEDFTSAKSQIPQTPELWLISSP